MDGKTARERADDFLKISGQFRLGELVTEASHPVTANLSEVAKNDIPAALDLIFEVDGDVVAKYREFAQTGRFEEIAGIVRDALLSGGRIFFTGCGATGRLSILLDSIWRDYWQRTAPSAVDWENRTVSIMAGGDFALIKSVEGFEDITAFGRRQIAEQGVCEGDIVFAITEGGETSWVIGTACEALEHGAKVYFVYNNPDEILREHVQRSHEVIDEPRIKKINLTTGPMAITGSTRMQATSIQLCVMLTIMEMALRALGNREQGIGNRRDLPEQLLKNLEEMHATLRSETVRSQLAKLVELEESIYRQGGRVNYFADSLAIDVLTDTTERSPTFCTPPFRRNGDTQASESWAFLFLPHENTQTAWEKMLKRKPRAIEWDSEIIKRISLKEIYRFNIGLNGLENRPFRPGDGAIGIIHPSDAARETLLANLRQAAASGAKTGLIFFDTLNQETRVDEALYVPMPEDSSLLGFTTRIAAKMLLNALSTCIMVRLGRVMGNYMIYVVPSNLKLIDRAARYISKLADLPYEDACRLLFEVIEYVELRMKTDQAYPPVVKMAVIRAKLGLSNEEAEACRGRVES
ncbi:MAG: hypothetical protein NT018_01125 [Armatimonadetes bacterium]|nr:hypothetical protein [Armatimonadota bacterium]